MSDSLIDDGPENASGGVNTPEFSVSEISGAVKRMVEGEFGHVRVRGEIGRVSRPRSGHIYMDLKDDRAVLSGVVWKGVAAGLTVAPEEGLEVIATGRLTTFPGQSKYQIVIEALAYAGEGALLARLERLKKALAAEGLFEPARKRPIPYLPRVVGVVTSPSGAVIRDILHRLEARFPVHVLLWPVAVQGQACAGEVAAAIRGFSALPEGGPVPRPDVVIVARGGGSVEDLWGFNEEAVVRAAAASAIPLISAVGHETDTTLIDFAADRRAPTPTAAAEMAVPVRAELAATVAELESRRRRALARGFELARDRLTALARALPRADGLLETPRQRLDTALARMPRPEALTEARAQELRLTLARMPRPAERLARAEEALARLADRLPRGLMAGVAERRTRLARGGSRLVPGLLTGRLDRAAERLADRGRRLDPAAARLRDGARDRLAGLSRLLETLGYTQTLARGYAVVRDGAGGVRTRAAGIAAGSPLEIEFADGRIAAVAGAGLSGKGSTGNTGGSGGSGGGGSDRPAPKRKKPKPAPPSQPSLFGPEGD
ncbi:exodeoxyribonuclease VII large subunit [Paralimibaculum aggregatum]|uniref:Exodeoxyribonuclease 7 large subunit n=1 Tax=Paralimibaculum aggregatum TaxID=3036245 RepID=A0ABQ6LHX3_9RHOB|nr:exodeoxyribonuclease VII large subunit [Limibaculum sp. NKW23]GMG82892.1 exodeoxyribonuclease VII large subunit [Limibaculum sp. NKW23]